MSTVTTHWFCERCGARGQVDLDEHASVFAGIYAVEDDHHAMSPICDAPTRDLRVEIGQPVTPAMSRSQAGGDA